MKNAIVLPAGALLEEPKLVLPLVLNWLPQAGLLLVASAFLAANPELLANPLAFAAALQENFFGVLTALLPVLAAAAVVLLLSFATASFVSLWYAFLAKQLRDAKKASLSESFVLARKEFLRFFAALLVAGIALLAGFSVLAVVSIAALALANAALAGTGFLQFGVSLLLGLLAAAAGGLLLVSALLSLWFFPATAGLGKAGGLEALKQGTAFAKQNFVAIAVAFAIVLAVNWVAGAAGQALAAGIPLLGYALAQLVYLPVGAWAALVPVRLWLDRK